MYFLYLFIIFIFIINISFIVNNNNKEIVTNQILSVFNWTKIEFFDEKKNETIECLNCIPSIIKFYKNRLFVSFPRYNIENEITFAYYNEDKSAFIPYPDYESNKLNYSNNINNNDDNIHLKSVNGFEIDEENNILYILDNARIENNKTIYKDNICLYIFNLKDERKKAKKIINFNHYNISLDTSNLINFAVDISKNIAYVLDSGNPFLDNKTNSSSLKLSDYHPALLIVYINENPEDIKIYRILEDRKEFYPDFSYWIKINDNKLYKNFPYYFGINGITLDCSFNTLYFSSISSRKIYSILTKTIEKYIDKNIINKKEGNFYDIEIYENYKEESSDGILASRNKKLYFTGLESGSIYIAKKVDVDLIRFTTKKIIQIKGNNTIKWPNSLTFKDNSVYFLSNQKNIYIQNNYINIYNNKNDDSSDEYYFKLLRYDLGEKDYSYIKKCTSNEKGFKTTIIVWILFSIIIMIVLSFVFMGSGKQDEIYDKKNIKLISKKKEKIK